MSLSESDLLREAAATGFQSERLEKVVRLLELLEALRSHPFLKKRLVLKGGTALNLFVFDVPRLSVDIDLNYVGAVERETMLAERPRIEQAFLAVCGRLDLEVRRSEGRLCSCLVDAAQRGHAPLSGDAGARAGYVAA
jgi:predicted nucleotidyltransferase component of viral defense system